MSLEINSLYPETGLAQVRISAAATTCAERTVSIRQRCTKRAFQGPLSTRTTLNYPKRLYIVNAETQQLIPELFLDTNDDALT